MNFVVGNFLLMFRFFSEQLFSIYRACVKSCSVKKSVQIQQKREKNNAKTLFELAISNFIKKFLLYSMFIVIRLQAF